MSTPAPDTSASTTPVPRGAASPGVASAGVASSGVPSPAVGIGASYTGQAVPPHVPHAPRPPQRGPVWGLLAPGRSRESLLTAAIAVGAVILVKFAVAFVQLIGNAVDFDPASYASGFLQSPIGLFLGAVVLFPFFFYAGAFGALALAFPVERRTPLPIAMGRAVAAGAVGTILLALAGLVVGIAPAAAAGSAVSLVIDAVFIPLAAGILLTAVLVAGVVAGWLWLGRQEPLVRTQDATAAGAPAAAAATAGPAVELADAAAPTGAAESADVEPAAAEPAEAESAGAVEPAAATRSAAVSAPAEPAAPVPAAADETPPPADYSRFAPPPADRG